MIRDGFSAITKGVDSSRSPDLLPRDQAEFGVNTTFRGGFPTNRPGFKKLELSFVDSSGDYDATVESNFSGGRFQGASYYDTADGLERLIVSVSGRIFEIDVVQRTCRDITIDGDTSSEVAPTSYFVQAENYLIIQNGLDLPLIYNGASLRRSDPYDANEIPVGTVMEYGQGRLWVASQDRYSFVAGDIAYGPSGTALNGYRDAVLKFTENDLLAGGGAFAVPSNSGGIRAMKFLSVMDTSTGQGPLQILTDSSIFSVNAPTDRATWQSLTHPIQSTSLVGYGGVSQRSVVPVNGDLWYRAPDGIRSLVLGIRDFRSWGKGASSCECERVLAVSGDSYLDYTSAIQFDNRLLVTCSPENKTDYGVFFNGLVSLDFNPICSTLNPSPPVWEGVWTGLRFLQILSGRFAGKERAFSFHLTDPSAPGSSPVIELWEVTRDEDFDNLNGRIPWQWSTSSFGFEQDFYPKRLMTGELWVDDIKGTVDFDVDYKEHSQPKWEDWHSWSECSTWGVKTLAVDGSDTAANRKRFAFIGDYGMAGPEEQSVKDLVDSWGVDFIVTGGGNNYPSGASGTFTANVTDYYGDYITNNEETHRFWPTIGWVDWQDPGAAAYHAGFPILGGDNYYTRTEGPVQFFFLSSDGTYEPDGNWIGSTQYNWLVSELATSTSTWKVVVWAQPAYSSGTVYGGFSFLKWDFKDLGIHAVLCGHEKHYERFVIDDVVYIVGGWSGATPLTGIGTPSTGSKVQQSGVHGAVLCSATVGSLSFRAKSADGAEVDYYALQRATGSCTPPEFPLPQARNRLMLPEPGDSCTAATQGSVREGYNFQMRFNITGPARFTKGRLKASPLEGEEAFGDCPSTTQDCPSLTGCDSTTFNYKIS